MIRLKICLYCKKEFFTINKKLFCSIYCCKKNWELNNIEKRKKINNKYSNSLKNKKRIIETNYYKNYYLKNKEKLLLNLKKYENNNREKKKAHNIIHNDKITNPQKYKNYCEVCGELKNINQHHEDYNKPYEVIALCKICHIKIHKLELMV